MMLLSLFPTVLDTKLNLAFLTWSTYEQLPTPTPFLQKARPPDRIQAGIA